MKKHLFLVLGIIIMAGTVTAQQPVDEKQLEKAYLERDPHLTYLNAMPLYDKLRSDLRFIALLKKMGLE